MHMNTWVAECMLHKSIGRFISSFKDKIYLMDKLFRARAKMKMFAENSPHAGMRDVMLRDVMLCDEM
jgi:hypothetical protein